MMPLPLTMNPASGGISHHHHHPHHFEPPSTSMTASHRQRHMSHDVLLMDQQHSRRLYTSDPFTSLPSSPEEKPHTFAYNELDHAGVDLSYDHGGHESLGILRMYGRTGCLPPPGRVMASPSTAEAAATQEENTSPAQTSAMAHGAHHHPVPARSMTSGGLWMENLVCSPSSRPPGTAVVRSRASSVPPAAPEGAGISGFIQFQLPAHQDMGCEHCAVCGDKATGKHYGASSCDGCKGFFRRSIRKNQKYACRSKRNCPVDKERRNQCRYCRLMKCLRTGMKREAVQNERDRISSRKNTGDEGGIAKQLTIEVLLQAETALMQMGPSSYDVNLHQKRLARVDDVTESAAAQLLNLVQWAKLIPSFNDLAMNDKIALLKTHAGEHLLLGLTRRSMELKGILLLSNDTIIDRNSDEQRDLFGLGGRIMDELVDPLNEVKVDDTEFACLRAFVFFDPYVKGLEEKEKVKEVRNDVLVTLEDYVAYRICDQRGRFGKLFGVLVSLQSIKQQLIEEVVQYAKIFGKAKLDNLLREMLLGEDDPSVAGEDVKMANDASSLGMLQETFYNSGQMSGATTPHALGSQSPEATPTISANIPQQTEPSGSRQFVPNYASLPVADMGLMNGGEPAVSERYYGPRRNFLLQYQSEQQLQLLGANREDTGPISR